MKTVVVLSTRGFGVFRHDLLAAPGDVRFVAVVTEQDSVNIPAEQRAWLDRVAVVPCAIQDVSSTEASVIDLAAARAVIGELAAGCGPGELTLHCFDERNLLVTAALREEFGLPGPTREQLLPYRDKILMKQRLAGTGLRVPRFGRIDGREFAEDRAGCLQRITDEVGLPFVVKPVDAASADGVHKIFSPDDFLALPDDLGRAYEYEEHVEGVMYSVNLVTRDGRTVFRGVTEYLVNSTEVQNGRVNADINLIDSDPRVARMTAFAETALDALGRLDGASHLELFRTKADELVFLEVGARYKGQAGLAAMQENYAIALLNLALEIEAGVPSLPWDREQVYCFDGVIPKRPGTVTELRAPDIASECVIDWHVRPGEHIAQGTSLVDNGGMFLVRNRDYAALYRDFERLAAYEPIRYEEEPAC